MKRLSNSLREAFLKMGFFKRTFFSLVFGFGALLGISIGFEILYECFFTYPMPFLVASLVLSQVWLYKPAAEKLVKGDRQEDDPTPQTERQSAAEGDPAGSSTTLEEEARELGDDFSVPNEELVDGEEP